MMSLRAPKRDILEEWPRWRDELILHLRLKGVPGDKIGDILFEVESHTRDTGESPEDAFGSAKEYAGIRSVHTEPTERGRIHIINQIIVPGIGGYMLAAGAWGLGSGNDSWSGWQPWLMLSAGIAIMLWVFLRLDVDLVRDPRNDRPLVGSAQKIQLTILGSFAVMALVLFTIGWIFGR